MYNDSNETAAGSNRQLGNVMIVHPPEFYSLADSVLNFSRLNDIDLRWDSFNKKAAGALSHFRYYLGHADDGDKNFASLENEYWKKYTYNAGGADQETICLIHRKSGRLYGVFNDDSPIGQDFFSGAATLDDAWIALAGLNNFTYRVVQLSAAGNTVSMPSLKGKDYIDRGLLFYKEQFEILDAKLKFVRAINSSLDIDRPHKDATDRNYIQDLVENRDSVAGLLSDKNALELTIANYSNNLLRESKLKEEISVVAGKLFKMGYYLHTGPDADNIKVFNVEGSVKHGIIYGLLDDTKKVEGKKGKRKVLKLQWDFSKTNKPAEPVETWVWEEYQEPPTLVPVTILAPVTLYEDPVDARILQLKKDGKYVHVISNRKGNYVSDEGLTLKHIMQLCESSEEVRLNTFVIEKVYDYLCDNKTAIIGAYIYNNPLIEIIPSRLPGISFLETLDYRMSWNGLELGRLIASINLAPGESKTISVSTKFSQTVSESRSIKSFSETDTLNSSEATTEFQTEASKELEKVSEVTTSVEAGGSYMGASAKGSMTSSNKDTLKDFAKQMSKVANKVTNSINQKNSLEVNSSISTSAQTTSDSSKTSVVSNINQGSTLNLYYYQLHNRFKSGLFFDGLQLQFTGSHQLIEGSGIYETITVKVKDIVSFYDQLIGNLPQTYFNFDLDELKRKVVVAVLKKIEEYDSVILGTSWKEAIDRIKSNIDNDNEEELFEMFADEMKKIDVTGIQISDDNVILDANSYYLDALVGINPATEQYSETMRVLESQKTRQDVERQRLQNQETKTKIALLSSGTLCIKSVVNFDSTQKIEDSTEVPVFISILYLSDTVQDNNYRLIFNNTEITGCRIELSADKRAIIITWTPGFDKTTSIEDGIMLIHRDNFSVLKKL